MNRCRTAHPTRTTLTQGAQCMRHWFTSRPRSQALEMKAVGGADRTDHGGDEGQGGWHASSLDLAAGLQVWEPALAEAEELLRRHFAPGGVAAQ